MKKHYTTVLQLVLLTLFIGTSYGQVNTSTPGAGSNTVPANAVSATVQIWGAGGAGGGSTRDGDEGAGGGGGAYSTRTFTVLPGQTINYNVGVGGTGSNGNGTSGENTTLTHTPSGVNMTANGGGGGRGNNNAASGGIGVGGTATGGTTNTPGQNGGPGYYSGGSTGGDGGDGANGGVGGIGRNDADGDNGSIPGGGGGGGERRSCSYCYHSGGNGANGRVIITYTIVSTPTVASFTPTTACVGTNIVITGTNFIGVTAVRFNGVDATSYTVNSTTQITAVVPVVTSGPITVTTPGGIATSGTITIENPVDPAGIISGTATVCQGESAIAFEVPAIANATSYNWTLPTGASIATGSGTRNITVNFSSSAASGTVSVRGTNSCGDGAVSNFPVTVNTLSIAPTSIGITNDLTTICAGQTRILSIVGGTAGTNATAEWFTGSCDGTPFATGNTVNVLPLAPTTTYFVRYAGGCNTTTCASIEVTVENAVTGGVITGDNIVCQGDNTVTYTLTEMANQTSYLWTVPTGATFTGQFTNTIVVDYGTAAISGDVTVTGENTCGTRTITLPVTVNPLPDDAGPISGIDELCQGEEGVVYTVPTIANATGYNWTLPTGATIVSGANTNSITVDYAIGASSGNVTVEGFNTCGPGVPFSLPITVNITPFIDINYSPIACSGEEIIVSPADGGGNIVPPGTTYSWSVPTPMPAGLTGATALSGQTNFNQNLINSTSTAQTVTYDVTATTAGCSSSTFTIFVRVNPKPIGQGLPATQNVCPNTAITTINFSQTTTISGTISYSWTRDNTGNIGGLGAFGSGASINATLTNTSSTAQTTTFTVTASTQDGCDSDPFYVSVTVDPTPTVAASPQTQSICSEGTITPIALTNPNVVSGTTYSWTRSNTANITGIADGSGSSITGALTNNTNVPQTTVFTITASANGCPSSTTTASVTVNPKPTVAVNLPTQVVCGGDPIADILITNPNNISGVTYSWTRTDGTALTGLSSGTGATIAGTINNPTGGNLTAVFTITATSGTCASEITTASVEIRPTPLIVATPLTQTICNELPTTIALSITNGNISGHTFSWTRNNNPNVTVTGPSSGTGNITNSFQNTTATPQEVTYEITATRQGCSSTTTATVTVNPTLVAPVIGYSQEICGSFFGLGGGEAVPLYMTTPVSGGSGTYNYQWQRYNGTIWTNVGTNNDTFTPTAEGYYRLIVSDSSCSSQTVTSNEDTRIRLTGVSVTSPNISGGSNTPICNGTFVPPISVNINHSFLSNVKFYWNVNNSYITPTSGGPEGSTSGFILENTSHTFTNTFTTNNPTNSTQTSIITITPRFTQGSSSCNTASATRTIQIRPTPIAYTAGGGNTICSGGTPNIAISGNITDGPMRFRIQRTGGTNITGILANSYVNVGIGGSYNIPALTNTSATAQTITFTITPYHNYDNNNNTACGGTPITTTVTVAPQVNPGVIAASQTVCTNGDPVAFTQTTPATGLNLSYQWEMSTTDATSGFSPIAGATSITYDAPGPLTQNTWYRRIATSTVNSVSCSSVPSNVVQVTVNIINPGEIAGEQTVCSGGDPTTLSNTTHAAGIGPRSYQWQMNTTGCEGTWINIPGATAATYNPPAGLLTTTYYRRSVTYSTGGDCPDFSNCITVYVNDVTGGDISGDQIICGTNPEAFTVDTPSTGTGLLTYQWQLSTTNSTTGPWTDISGANSATYDPPSGVNTTTYYKRVTISTLNGQACTADSASVITVTASTLEPGMVAGNRTICSGEIPAAFTVSTAATVGSGGISYQWRSSTTSGGGPWTDIVGATSATYTFTSSVSTTTYYQRVATSILTGCSKESNFLTVFVNSVTPSVIAGNQTVCNTQDPAAFTVTTAASTAVSGAVLSYQWQSSTANAPYAWSNITGATNATYDPPVLATTTYYQVVVTSRLNSVNCSAVSNIVTVVVNPFIAAVASSATPANCSDTTIQLTANGNGTWTAVPRTLGALYSFSNTTATNATFTGESGVTYDITWTIVNPSPCNESTATFALVFPPCADDIDFNGTNNYTNFKDEFNFTTDFSIELWVKPNTNTATKQTLFSKRDANDLSTGYDLSLENGLLTFNWDTSGLIQATQALNMSRWFHVAVTHIAGTYRLYIDGIDVGPTLTPIVGPLPSSNAFNAILGATGRAAGVPQDYYNGSVDELRIWNTGLTADQIREMMNQEIEVNGTAVRGSELQLNVAGLDWADLAGYYQMNQGTADVTAGQLADNSGTGNVGTLTNMVSNQDQSAPLPYTSQAPGNWTANGTWTNGTVQQTPNSIGIDGSTFVDWNIVRTGHNVTATNKDVIVLGLLMDAGRLTIQNSDVNDGQSIEVTRYLNIANNAILDLVGESQLLQRTDDSFVGPGTGILERDQQGTGNMFNYNYWGSPVSTAGTVGSRTYDLRSIINDGDSDEQVNWIAPHTFTPTASPVTISTRWLYTYKGHADDYDVWSRITPDSPIEVGVGFLMKGSGLNTALDKNYTFKGQPNNGDIIIPIGGPDQAIVIGNPYPSAIDAFEFIVDNDGALLDGTLQFWQQSPNASTHVYAQYQGGYGYLTLSGGAAPVSPPDIDGVGGATTEPQQFIPVGQGFYVNASPSGGNITFKNSYRIFAKESDGQSVFLRTPESKSKTVQKRTPYVDDIQRVRLAFKTPEGAIRNLLLAFTPDNAATDGIDYGYDGRNGDEFPSDLTFAIEGKQFVIQGVGAFDINKKYPLDMTLKTPGNVELALTRLENFDKPIDVYLHDAVLDTYTKINNVDFQMEMKPGSYKDRFFIVFRPDNTLSTIDQDFKDISVKYLQKTDEIYVKTPASIEVRQLYLINMAGQAVKSWNMTNMNFGQEFKIPVKDVAEGNYILQVETNTNSYNKKIIIKF